MSLMSWSRDAAYDSNWVTCSWRDWHCALNSSMITMGSLLPLLPLVSVVRLLIRPSPLVLPGWSSIALGVPGRVAGSSRRSTFTSSCSTSGAVSRRSRSTSCCSPLLSSHVPSWQCRFRQCWFRPTICSPRRRMWSSLGWRCRIVIEGKLSVTTAALHLCDVELIGPLRPRSFAPGVG